MGLNPAEKRNVLAAVSRIAAIEQGLEQLGRAVDELSKEVRWLRTQMVVPVPKKFKKEDKEN